MRTLSAVYSSCPVGNSQLVAILVSHVVSVYAQEQEIKQTMKTMVSGLLRRLEPRLIDGSRFLGARWPNSNLFQHKGEIRWICQPSLPPPPSLCVCGKMSTRRGDVPGRSPDQTPLLGHFFWPLILLF